MAGIGRQNVADAEFGCSFYLKRFIKMFRLNVILTAHKGTATKLLTTISPPVL